MFTGIVHSKQSVISNIDTPAGKRLTLQLAPEGIEGLKIGASVSVSGVCLTATAIEGDTVSFDIMQETLTRSTLGALQAGDAVNIERSFTLGSEVGGHILSGHITGTAEITAIRDSCYVIRASCEWMKYIFPQGFIALDGCSLTIVETNPGKATFSVALIPETLARTTFGERKVGDKVNVEIDTQTRAIVDTVERVLKEKGN